MFVPVEVTISARYMFFCLEIIRQGKCETFNYAYSGNMLLQEKVVGRLISLVRTESFVVRNAARDALLRINVCIYTLFFIFTFSRRSLHLFCCLSVFCVPELIMLVFNVYCYIPFLHFCLWQVHSSTLVKFIELISTLGDARGHSKRIKRNEDRDLNVFCNFAEIFGENSVASILVSLLDILFLKKDVKQRSGTT